MATQKDLIVELQQKIFAYAQAEIRPYILCQVRFHVKQSHFGQLQSFLSTFCIN